MNNYQQRVSMWAVGVLLLLLLAGCASTPALEIVNDSSDDTICAIYTALPEDEYWSDNHLAGLFGPNEMPPGDTMSLDLTPGVYDIRMEDCSHKLLLAAFDVDIAAASAPYRLEVTRTELWYGDDPEEATLRITNAHPSQEICFVYFSPTSSEDWGGDRLGVEQTLAPSESHDFQVPEQTYDIALDDCNRNVLMEEYEVFVSGVYEFRYNE
jgi:hypothetical protein